MVVSFFFRTFATQFINDRNYGNCAFIRQLGKRMGWTVSEAMPSNALYDPESKSFLNEETMQAIRDVESGNVMKCKNLDEILATL